MYRLLDHISTKELRCCAVGRALVTKETAHNMPRDELQELLEPFAYGITYDPPSIKLHPFTDPLFTYSEVNLRFLEHLLLLENMLLSSLSLSLSLSVYASACGKS